MEIATFVDQKLRVFLEQHAAEFAAQGTVVVSWRRYRGCRRGPYFRLAWRGADGRQRLRYVGSDHAVLAEIERWFAALRGPRETTRRLAEARRILRRAMRQERGHLRRELAALGLSLKGAEIRGWRHARQPEEVGDDAAKGKPAELAGCKTKVMKRTTTDEAR